MESMRTKIQSNLDALEVRVEDQSGDGQHVCISVVAEVFQDKTSVQRQRLVYKSIWLELLQQRRPGKQFDEPESGVGASLLA